MKKKMKIFKGLFHAQKEHDSSKGYCHCLLGHFSFGKSLDSVRKLKCDRDKNKNNIETCTHKSQDIYSKNPYWKNQPTIDLLFPLTKPDQANQNPSPDQVILHQLTLRIIKWSITSLLKDFITCNPRVVEP
jgi:hypothetical protein